MQQNQRGTSGTEQPTATEATPGRRTRTLPPMQVFHDILAGRAPNRRTPGVLWPDFDTQTHVRLWRDRRPFCLRPTIDASNPEVVEEPCAFVSVHDDHFGHICSETVPRIPQTLADAPDLPLYFSSARPMGPQDMAPVFRAILDWLHVPLERLRFVYRPTLFRELHVAAQAEQLNGPPPPPEYLDLLEERIAGNLPPVTPEGVVYVSRAQLSPESGRMAGERYLAFCLQQAGVQVIYPEMLSLPEQMRIYAGARHLVFAEGSAVHGRQLLGRLDQEIWILRRRPRSHIALHQLEPRCRALHYVASQAGGLTVTNAEGWRVSHSMCSLYRVDAVLEHFEGLGVPLGRIWRNKLFERQRDEDVLSWLRAVYHPTIAPWLRPHNTDEAMLGQFEALGLQHLTKEAAALMKAHR